MASHFGLDFNRVEDLAVVNSDDGTNHFWDDDHVPEVGLYYCGLFVGRSFFLGLSQFLDQTQGFAFEAAVETPASAGMDNFNELLVVEIQELLELNATVREGSECPFFLELGGNSGVGSLRHGRYLGCGSEA